MSSFEKAGVLFITGLVAVILALALFGTSGTTTPPDDAAGAGGVASREADAESSVGVDPSGEENEPNADDLWKGIDQPGPIAPGPIDPAPPSSGREHVVRAGDRLANIAKQYLGDAGRWQAIVAANPGLDPARLKVGQKLTIPEAGLAAGPAPRPEPERSPSIEPDKRSPVATGKKPFYVVKKGDTLTSIAQRELRDRAAWRKLYDMNKSVVKNANRLPVGLTLTLPAN